MKEFEIPIGGQNLKIEMRGWAERANSEALVRYGATQVLATVVMSEREAPRLGFFPLTVNYEERYYAAGKILGSRYIKREGRPSDNAILISRLIDRTIRPGFDKNLNREVQVIVTCLSWDQENDPDVLGILAASLALTTSNIPWQGPIGATRVGFIDNQFILNPTYEKRERAVLDIVFAGPQDKEGVLINMIEGNGEEAGSKQVIESWQFAQPTLAKLIQFQKEITEDLGQEKIGIVKPKEPELEKALRAFLKNRLEKLLYQKEKQLNALNDLKEELTLAFEENPSYAQDFFEEEINRLIHQNILEKERRPDSRKLEEIRPLLAEVGVVPRGHGSGFFGRGITKSLSILTLGGPGDQQLIEGMEIRGKKRFLHHYNFPPYSVGEVRPLRGPSRRDIGHGMLVEKALLPVIPDLEQFLYTIRIVSEILSSNGSTSMASVCSSSLALMDAGVPIKGPVAGIALGLIQEGKKHKVLVDIQGPEDFHGDMDFKIAGTRQGITALQMDVKVAGINPEVLSEALAKAEKARVKILDRIEKTIAQPRKQLSPFAPRIFKLQIAPEKIGLLIGPKGQTIKRISEEYGVEINIEDSGSVYLTAEDKDQAQKAVAEIKNIVREIKVGEVFLGTVKRILAPGTMIEINSNQEGLIHKSQSLPEFRIGQRVLVKVDSIDELGRINLKPQIKKTYGRA